MANLNKIEDTDVLFRVKWLQALCVDYMEKPSGEFYDAEEKIASIGRVSELLLQQAAVEFGLNN